MATDRGFPSMWERVIKEDEELFADPVLRTYYPEYMAPTTSPWATTGNPPGMGK